MNANEIPALLSVNGADYQILRLLGKGKGGYSYLAAPCGADSGKRYVLKQIHHEPCSYYSFGDKLQSELRDYERLNNVGIRLPRLLDCDVSAERILKEYIDGPTVAELVKADALRPEYYTQVQEMCALLYAAGLNIDYYPTNFVVQEELLYYIDYECNAFMAEWSFENWGSKYWSRTPEFTAAFGEA